MYQARNDLLKAEAALIQALVIDRELGRSEEVAHHYGDLALVYEARGDLNQACKSLDLFRKTGADDMAREVRDWLEERLNR